MIKAIAQSELLLESCRDQLASQNLFEPSTAFKRLDQNRLGELKLDEIIDFLEDNRVPYTQADAAYLFKRLDQDHDGRINYQDFQRAILPRTDQQLREVALKRPTYHIDVGMLLPTEIEQALAQLFSQEL